MTTTPDFRALCAELLAALETEGYTHWTINPSEDPLVKRALTALATPPPEPLPLPDHVNLIGFAFGREPWATWLQQGGCLESAHRELSDLMLAVLAHWGRPATPPPEPPTDEELWAFWNNHDGPIPAILRAALERWGHR